MGHIAIAIYKGIVEKSTIFVPKITPKTSKMLFKLSQILLPNPLKFLGFKALPLKDKH